MNCLTFWGTIYTCITLELQELSTLRGGYYAYTVFKSLILPCLKKGKDTNEV